MRYTLKQVEGFLASNLVETERSAKDVHRQIAGLYKSLNQHYDLQVEVLLGATSAIEEQNRYDDEFDEDELDENGERWDSEESDAIYDACSEAQDWLEDTSKGDLF